MSKYSSAREAIDLVVNNGEDLGLDREEMLSALIISALTDYQEH